jgi:hypothetical protein
MGRGRNGKRAKWECYLGEMGKGEVGKGEMGRHRINGSFYETSEHILTSRSIMPRTCRIIQEVHYLIFSEIS